VGDHTKPPHELLYGIQPDVSHLRVFGCKAYAYNFDITRKKLDDKAKPGIFVGYDDKSAAYKLYLQHQRKIIKSGHVVFHERCQENWGDQIQYELETDWRLESDEATRSNQCYVVEPPVTPVPATTIPDDVAIQKLLDKAREATIPKAPVVPTMVTRGIKRDYRALHHGAIQVGGERAYSVRETILHAMKSNKAELKEPTTFEETITSDQEEEWQQAINDELLSIYSNDIWCEVKLDSTMKPLTTKWVFKILRLVHRVK
jgi:hypothetical protein